MIALSLEEPEGDADSGSALSDIIRKHSSQSNLCWVWSGADIVQM